jgi:hypothetical protein
MLEYRRQLTWRTPFEVTQFQELLLDVTLQFQLFLQRGINVLWKEQNESMLVELIPFAVFQPSM